ncbi:MAG: ATP-binding protein [Candidatus Kapabacteria bacterium]|nr:ATP-binding protein [Candidatus Kapabacteria bacterium]
MQNRLKLFFITSLALLGISILIFGQIYKEDKRQKNSRDISSQKLVNLTTQFHNGMPFIRNFLPIDYNGEGENFDLIQDKRGIMYFANFSGIIEYDGTNWRTILTENINRIKSFAINSDGVIYAGGRKEFGILTPDNKGKLIFKNLAKGIDSSLQNFYEVIKIFEINNEIIFVSNNWIIKYVNNNFILITKDQAILNAFNVNNQIYFTDKNKGLLKIDNDNRVISVNQGSIFTDELKISFMSPIDTNKILIGTENDGFYEIDNKNLTKIQTESSQFIKAYGSNSGIRIGNEYFAIGTQRSGILILDNNFRIIDIIDESVGLISNYINSIYLSSDNGLWAATNNGIIRIDYFSPIKYFDKRSNLKGSIKDIIKFNNTIYTATLEGLYYLSEKKKNTFDKNLNLNTGCWDLEPFRDKLLIATSLGVVLYNKNNSYEILTNSFTFVIKKSSQNDNIIFAGTNNGLEIIENINNRYQIKKINDYLSIKNLDNQLYDEIRSIQEDVDGLIWAATSNNGIICLDINNKTIKLFNTNNGLPSNVGNSVNYINQKIFISTVDGVYTFDKTNEQFKIAQEFITDSLDTKSNWFNNIYQDENKRIWATDGSDKNFTELVQLENSQKTFNELKKEQKRFKPISHLTIKSIFTEYIEGSDNYIIWLGGNDGIIRFQDKETISNKSFVNTLIREITINNENNIFYGYSGASVNSKPAYFELLPDEKTLTFIYSSTSYDVLGKNEYQFMLEGFDKLPSEWTSATKKEYTNLSFGNYKFKVRSRNIYGDTSDFAEFEFVIKTPWYATIWAYFLYAAIGITGVFMIVRWRGRKLEREKQALEEVVEARTAEIMEQKEEIQAQSLQLFIKNDELEKINGIVQAINNEINFNKLLISILEKVKVLKVIDKATALVWDSSINKYKFKASLGWDISLFEGLALEPQDAEKRYISISQEIYEDIFIAKDFDKYPHLNGDLKILEELEQPQSFVTILIRIENKIEAYLILENFVSKNAFNENDLSLLRNLKEHLVSAFIKTKILEDLQITLNNLKETQQQLVQSEKLASLGQLTAGIAHEIQNPLNFVNNFSSLSKDLIDELNDEIEKEKEHYSEDDYDNLLDIINTLKENISKINEHGKRAESIVKGMLMHSRGKSGEFQLTDINGMVKEYVNLAYHGMRAQNHEFNTAIVTDYDESIGKVSIVPQDLSRVILNIVNNACYAVSEKSTKFKDGYSPKIEIITKKFDDNFKIFIKDNGTGIPQNVIDKIFQPFFTTKPTGKGTGLGLSMSYDIVTQIHRGKLEVNSVAGESTEFILTIPLNLKN